MSDAPHEPFGMPTDPTHQAVHDKVVRHLFRQGRQSVEQDECCYRAEGEGETLACAVGCLIPDDRYSRKIEVFGVHMRRVIEALGIEGEDHPLIPLLQDLQVVHDTAENWEGNLTGLARKLVVVARDHGLDTSEVARAHAAYLARRA